MRPLFAIALTAVGLLVARDYVVALTWAFLIATWPLYCHFAAVMPG